MVLLTGVYEPEPPPVTSATRPLTLNNDPARSSLTFELSEAIVLMLIEIKLLVEILSLWLMKEKITLFLANVVIDSSRNSSAFNATRDQILRDKLAMPRLTNQFLLMRPLLDMKRGCEGRFPNISGTIGRNVAPFRPKIRRWAMVCQ